jgi:2-polyprenyl-3-methyl-5-hydroxy-6-metoxy-1,4-benzoquinol methylase
MTTTPEKHEYIYANSNSQHHHVYIKTSLLDLLNQLPHAKDHKLRVLDLGCGNGSLSHVIANAGYEVTGIEPSASGIQFAQAQYPMCQFIEASVYDLPYKTLENQFDVVISAEVIEHLLYPRELVKAAKRCLKPGGQIMLTTPYHGYWKNLTLSHR